MSLTIREIFHRFHGVQVGLYSIGPCHVPPGNLPPGTTVGRYCSIYYTVQALDHDRPDAQFLPHGLFDGQALGQSTGIPPAKTALDIGNDVFIGHNAILLPSVQRIGDGAVIGAGSVVHQPVPPYAVVTGNPARVVRYRFSEAKIQELLESQWWLKSLNELRDCIDEFRTPLESGPVR